MGLLLDARVNVRVFNIFNDFYDVIKAVLLKKIGVIYTLSN